MEWCGYGLGFSPLAGRSALIDGFEDKYSSVLFRCAKGTRRYFSRTDDDNSWFLLELARNVVAVPCGRVLHIEVNLQIETGDSNEVEVKVPLCFDNGICSSKTDDGKEVEVQVTWYPEMEMHTAQSSDQSQQTSKEIGEQESIPTPPERSQLAEEETSEEICEQKPDAALQEPSHQVEKKVVIKTGLQGVLPVSHSSHSTSEGASNIMPEPLTLANAIGWGISLLGWVISPIISKLVNKGLSYLDDVTGSSANNLQNLEKKVLHLKLMLEAAQAVPPGGEKTKLEGWAKELKSAFYDAEDILDAIDYHLLKCKAMSHRQSVNTTKKKASPKKDFSVPRGSKESLRKTLKRIEDLIDEGQKLLPLLHLTTSGDNKSSPKQTTGSLSKSSHTTSEPPKVFGRDEDIEKIRSMLRGTPADGSVIGIHGIAGSGKTTLAQYVCEYEKNSEDSYFEKIMWIHVTKKFSVRTVYNEMLEIVSGPQEDKFSHLDTMQDKLKKELKGKRFILVLDDVWYPESVDEKNDLEKLLSPLKEADKGSRVLVTTRTADAAKFLGARNPMPIADMNEEEFLKMFMHYALDNSMISDQEEKDQFESIGRKISLLLLKSPLAARTVAGQLRIRTRRADDIDFWIDTLNRKRDLLNDTMGALWWSYHQLEEHVRQCFAYCSIFPRRYELTRDELVKMWMAQGFVDTSKTSDMEVAAREHFEVLLSTSFIQLKRKTDYLEQEYYTVHDLLHDLAGIVAGSDCFRIEKDMVDHQIPQDVRHLFIDSNNLGEFMDQIVKLDTLRTLVMPSSRTEITAKEFERMLKNLKKLRFVCVRLEKFGTNVIPECIGELKHLRYLGLHGLSSDTINLPIAFTKLYHLQELFVPNARQVCCPGSNNMADLGNLRRLESLWLNIPDIGRMPWLQTFCRFEVKKEKGYEITQLEKLDNIRGVLNITGLENIQSKEDARRANLSNKLRVSELSFDWEPNEETESSSRKKQKTAGHHQQKVTPEEILEALHPPALLANLYIWNYGGSTFPSWLSGEDGKLKHLEYLYFYNCNGSGSQFKFSKPLPKLHALNIYASSWNALPDNIKQLASLKEFFISGCGNIKSLPGLPSSLKELGITDCPNISTLPELPPSLEDLEIVDCSNIKSLPGLPSSLKELGIKDCPNISTLPELPPSLEDLEIVDCSNIKSLPGLPSSLKKLGIWSCPNISTLPELPPSLEKLQIVHCPNIKSLPGLPSSLKELAIRRCPNISTLPELPPSLGELKCEPYLVDSYPDRQAIGRINN